MNRFFGNKGLAAQGLKKIGEIAFAAKDELLYVGNEGKWGFCVEEAEAVEAGQVEEAKKIAGFADLLAPAVIQPNGKVTIHLIAGKQDSEKEIPAPCAKKECVEAELPIRQSKLRAAMNLKDTLRDLFSKAVEYSMDDLMRITGKGESNLRTTLCDLKNPKYAGGELLLTQSKLVDGKRLYVRQ